MTPVVEFDGLAVRFGRRGILHELRGSLSGRAIGLLGPNGAGKTTLIHTLLGFHAPSAGTARLFGLDIRHDRRQIAHISGFMPENESFIPGLTAIRFVRLMAELSGMPPRAATERAHEALFFVGLGEARYRRIETYSFGMKQLVRLAQAVVHAPRLLLLDEPTNGLDPPARIRMIRLIREIRDSGSTHVVVSSHLLRDVEECCDEVIVLREGRIAACCNLEEERASNRSFLELEVRGDDGAFSRAIGELGCEVALHDGRMKLVLGAGTGVADLYALASRCGVQIRRLSFKRDSLQDIFFRAMGNGT